MNITTTIIECNIHSFQWIHSCSDNKQEFSEFIRAGIGYQTKCRNIPGQDNTSKCQSILNQNNMSQGFLPWVLGLMRTAFRKAALNI